MKHVYLDHNAATPLDERVCAAMLPYLQAGFGNPSSPHAWGRAARAALDQAREQVAALVNAHPSQVIFTSGGTEANNLAIKGLARCATPGAVAVSAVEHASVLEPVAALERLGGRRALIRVDHAGRVTPELLEAALDPATRLVSVMMANNETGVIQDIARLSALARQRGAVFHTDAVQAAGKIAVDFAASGAQLLTLSAHKIHGPKGAGALILDKSLDLEPLLHGGAQEHHRRAGTENVAAIVGFGKAAELAAQELSTRAAHLLRLRQRLEELLRELPGAQVFAASAERLPNTVFFAVEGIDGETLLLNLDSAGYAVASGSACESGSQDPSHVLLAMGVERDLARAALRVSLGKDNTAREIDGFVNALTGQVTVLRNLAARLHA